MVRMDRAEKMQDLFSRCPALPAIRVEIFLHNMLEQLLPLLERKFEIQVAFQENVEDLSVLGQGSLSSAGPLVSPPFPSGNAS